MKNTAKMFRNQFGVVKSRRGWLSTGDFIEEARCYGKSTSQLFDEFVADGWFQEI